MGIEMTVLQQVKDYYLRFARPTADMAREISQKILTSEGVKDHPAPQDYLANRVQEQQNQAVNDSPAQTRPFDNRGRFISKDA
ncbi:MAG TPA: hypothetical protein VGF14_03070 [Alphaproteobacteria bacterium]